MTDHHHHHHMELQSKHDQYKQIIAKIKQEYHHLHGRLKTYGLPQQEYKLIIDRLDHLSNELHEMEKKYLEVYTQLQYSLWSSSSQQINNDKNNDKNNENWLNNIQSSLEECKAMTREKNQQLEASQKRIMQLEHELKNNMSGSNGLQRSVADLQGQLKQLKEQNMLLLSQIDQSIPDQVRQKMEYEMVRMAKKNQQLEQQLTDLTMVYERKVKQYTQLQDKMNETVHKMEQQAKYIQDIEQLTRNLQQKIQTCVDNKEVTSMNQQLDTLLNDRREMEKAMSSLATKYEKMLMRQQQIDLEQNKLHEIIKMYETQTHEAKDLSVQYRQTLSELNQTRDLLQAKSQEISLMNKEFNECKRIIQKQQEKLVDMENQKRVSMMPEEAERLRIHAEKLAQQLNDKQTRLSYLEKELMIQMEQHQIFQKEAASLMNVLNRQQNDLASLQNIKQKYKYLEEELAQCKMNENKTIYMNDTHSNPNSNPNSNPTNKYMTSETINNTSVNNNNNNNNNASANISANANTPQQMMTQYMVKINEYEMKIEAIRADMMKQQLMLVQLYKQGKMSDQDLKMSLQQVIQKYGVIEQELIRQVIQMKDRQKQLMPEWQKQKSIPLEQLEQAQQRVIQAVYNTKNKNETLPVNQMLEQLRNLNLKKQELISENQSEMKQYLDQTSQYQMYIEQEQMPTIQELDAQVQSLASTLPDFSQTVHTIAEQTAAKLNRTRRDTEASAQLLQELQDKVSQIRTSALMMNQSLKQSMEQGVDADYSTLQNIIAMQDSKIAQQRSLINQMKTPLTSAIVDQSSTYLMRPDSKVVNSPQSGMYLFDRNGRSPADVLPSEELKKHMSLDHDVIVGSYSIESSDQKLSKSQQQLTLLIQTLRHVFDSIKQSTNTPFTVHMSVVQLLVNRLRVDKLSQNRSLTMDCNLSTCGARDLVIDRVQNVEDLITSLTNQYYTGDAPDELPGTMGQMSNSNLYSNCLVVQISSSISGSKIYIVNQLFPAANDDNNVSGLQDQSQNKNNETLSIRLLRFNWMQYLAPVIQKPDTKIRLIFQALPGMSTNSARQLHGIFEEAYAFLQNIRGTSTS